MGASRLSRGQDDLRRLVDDVQVLVAPVRKRMAKADGHGAAEGGCGVTIDQALVHLQGIANRWRFSAVNLRRIGDEYKTAANGADEPDLRRVQFDESSRFYGYAREIDRDAEALELVIQTAKRNTGASRAERGRRTPGASQRS